MVKRTFARKEKTVGSHRFG